MWRLEPLRTKKHLLGSQLSRIGVLWLFAAIITGPTGCTEKGQSPEADVAVPDARVPDAPRDAAADHPIDAQQPDTVAKSCQQDTDCATGQFCERACSEASGGCVERPTDCDADTGFVPQCGCDGVSYYNACYRKLAGVQLAGDGGCKLEHGVQQKTCTALGGLSKCATGQTCVLFGQDAKSCSEVKVSSLAGKCWSLPTKCPEVQEGLVYSSCGQGAVACKTFCEAASAARQYSEPVIDTSQTCSNTFPP
jgi:hypothetical protein